MVSRRQLVRADLEAIPVGLAVYYFACRLLKVEEMELAAEALERPLARLRARLR